MREADSPKTLRAQLRKDGIFLTDVIGKAEGSRPAFARAPTRPMRTAS